MADLTRAPEFARRRLDLPIGRSRHAVRIARIHSIFVRYLRHLIIFGCAFAVSALGVIIFFDPFRHPSRDLSLNEVGVQGSVVTLQSPKTKGYRDDGEPFELEGVSGTQDILNPHIVNLVGVDAKIGLDDATTAKITAQSGVYDSSQNVVWLRTNVRIKNDMSGYDMRLRSATLDLDSSALVTEEPVTVLMDDGSTISADRMDISDSGHKILFEGQVNSTIVVGGASSGASSSGAAQ